MTGLSTFGLSRSSSFSAAESQTTVASSTPVNTKLPYWAPTPEEVQGTQVVTTPSRTLSMRGRKPVVASKATPTPSPAQAIPRKPVPTPTAPARRFSYEPVVGNPYAETITTRSRNPLRAYPAANNRSSSPPYVPTGRAQSPEQLRPLSPGSIFANPRPAPARPATRKGSFAPVSRGIGSLKKASATVKNASSAAKKALIPQHEPRISSPIAGSFQRGFPEGHALAPEYVAPLNLVGLEVARADTARYGQPAIQFSTGPGAGETTRITATRADSYRRLTGEAAPANLGSPSPPPATNPAPPAANSIPSKTTVPRKAVESTFGDIMDAGMDASWAPNPRAGLDRPPPVEKSFAWPWTKGKGKASAPEAPTDTSPPPTATDTPPPPPATNNLTAELNPFAALGSAAQMFKKQGQANQPLPSTSAPQTSAPPEASLVPKPLAPRHFNTSQAVQLASQAPLVPGTDFTQDLRDRRTSQHLRITCMACGKLIYAAAIASHHCAKPKMTEAEKAAFNPRFSQFFPASKKRGGEQGDRQVAREAAVEDERPEVFVDTYVQAATTVWRTVTRQ
jgi:hypothetical protein